MKTDWNNVRENPYDPKWDYKKLSEDPDLDIDYAVSSFINLPWNWYRISHHPKFTWGDWNEEIYSYDYNHLSKLLPTDWDIVEYFPEENWCWTTLSMKPKSDINWELVARSHNRPNFKWDWRALSANPDLDWSFVGTNLHLPWDWKELSRHCNIDWSFVLANASQQWDWELLSNQYEIDWTVVHQLSDKPWKFDAILTVNTDVRWLDISEEEHYKKAERIGEDYWVMLSSCVHFNSNTRKIDFSYVLLNHTLPWDYNKLSEFSDIDLSVVSKMMDKPWKWKSITYNVTRDITYLYLISEYPDYDWDWQVLSSCSHVDPNLYHSLKHKPWDTELLEANFKKQNEILQRNTKRTAMYKEELLAIAWHPSRFIAWCTSVDFEPF